MPYPKPTSQVQAEIAETDFWPWRSGKAAGCGTALRVTAFFTKRPSSELSGTPRGRRAGRANQLAAEVPSDTAVVPGNRGIVADRGRLRPNRARFDVEGISVVVQVEFVELAFEPFQITAANRWSLASSIKGVHVRDSARFRPGLPKESLPRLASAIWPARSVQCNIESSQENASRWHVSQNLLVILQETLVTQDRPALG